MYSLCISCSVISSVSTPRNVPNPTWSRTCSIWTHFCLIFSSSSGVKCKLAVGAAQEPGVSWNTVWYRSVFSRVSVIYGGRGNLTNLLDRFEEFVSRLVKFYYFSISCTLYNSGREVWVFKYYFRSWLEFSSRISPYNPICYLKFVYEEIFLLLDLILLLFLWVELG